MKSEKNYNKIIYPIVFLLALAADRITKNLAAEKLKDHPPVDLLGKIFQLSYVENHGAAFGMLQGKQIFFAIITFLVVLVILYFLLKIPKDISYLKLGLVVTFILAGAVGNFIDRIQHGYVVDFLYFSPIDFPVFNVADICVTVGSILFAILVLFVYKDRDFDFLALRKDDDTAD